MNDERNLETPAEEPAENLDFIQADALRETLQSLCFAGGMTVHEPIAIRLDSPTYRQVRTSEEQAAKHRAEHDSDSGHCRAYDDFGESEP